MAQIMNDTDKILKVLDKHGKVLNQHGQILTSLVQNVATVLEKQQEQNKQISAVKEAVLLVDMKVDAGNNKLVSSVAELIEDMATKADVLNVGVKVDKLKKRIEGLEDDLDMPHTDKN